MPRWTELGQIAMSVLDVEATVGFYERTLGYARNGGVRCLFNGRVTDKVLAYPKVRHQLRWMSDQSPDFQLELVHFDNPAARAMPADARACDPGYQRMTVWVQDFDGAVGRLRAEGALVFGEPRDWGTGRRVCCRDPNGVIVELMERDIVVPPSVAKAQARVYRLPVRTRAISLSVSSLEAALPFFETVLGMSRADLTLHTPEMEALWGLPGARASSALLWAGSHLLELIEYQEPRGRPGPADHSLGDAGIYHVALRFERAADVEETYREVIAAGYHSNSAPADVKVAKLVYLRSPDDHLVECLYYRPFLGRFIGYREQPWQ